MALFKRVLETQGRFIPQTWSFRFFMWVAKDTGSDYQWLTAEYQIDHCSYNTLEEAKNSLIIKKPNSLIVKIHKA